MSHFYDPIIGPPRRTQNTPVGTNLQGSVNDVYVRPYGRSNELDDQRQQNAYEDQHIGALIPEDIPEFEARRQREYMRYIRGEHSPAGTGSYRMSGFENSSTSRHFPARAGSLPGSPDLWASQRDTVIQGQRDEHSDLTADRRHPRRDTSAPNPDHADLLSEKDRLAKRYAEIGPAAYIEGITVRDSLRFPALSMPNLRPVLLEEPAPADEVYLQQDFARDGLSVPHLRPIFPTGPSFAEKTLLAERVGALGPEAYMARITSQDSLRPLSWHPLPEGPALPLDEVDPSQNSRSRTLIRSLDGYYRRELKGEPGHRFDNVNDTVVAAYINVHAHASDFGQGILRIIGREQPFSVFYSWIVQIPFLRLQQSALEVLLPIDRDAIREVNNDILRVLYVYLSNGSRTIPHPATDADVEDSRRTVLVELEHRGFTEKLPRVARFRGLSDRSADRMSEVPGLFHDTASSSRSDTLVNQSSRWPNTIAAGGTRDPKDRRDNKARQRVLRGEMSITDYVFGEVSEKKKGKAPVAEDGETDSSDHSSAASSSNTVQHELEVSSSEDCTPPAKGKAAATKVNSRGKSRDSSQKTKHKANKTPSRRRSSRLNRKSDH
jgi:hypothetical protein